MTTSIKAEKKGVVNLIDPSIDAILLFTSCKSPFYGNSVTYTREVVNLLGGKKGEKAVYPNLRF